MFPRISSFYVPNGAKGYTVFARNLFMVSGIKTDEQNLFFGQSRPVMPFAMAMASLPVSICAILLSRPEPKMICVYARRIVASVTDLFARGDGAVLRNPCGYVGAQMAAAIAKFAIAILIRRGRPDDTAAAALCGMKGQFLGQSDFARREAYFTLRFSQDRLPRAIAVRVGDSVCALLRPAHYSTVPCA